MDDKLLELVHQLMYQIHTVHLDMGGNHRYALNNKAHDTITEIKAKLAEIDMQEEADDWADNGFDDGEEACQY